MQERDQLADEIVRLRDRMHAAESKLVGLEIHAENMLTWQRRYEPIIEDLREADRIADGVAERLNEKYRMGLTKKQVNAAIWTVRVAALALVANIFVHYFG